MPKQIIISMAENYPFGECEEITNENTKVLVRKIYQVSLQERNKLLEKVNILRKLKSEHMIKIESVLEEEQSIHFLFEYIPIKVETWISNINEQFIENFRDQLIKFSSFLANNYIKIDFQLKNIGMDHNYGAKYFLDLNFEQQPNLNREKLKSNYIREITNLFKPYLDNAIQNEGNDSDRQQNSGEYNTKQTPNVGNSAGRKQETAISPPTNKGNPKIKEKALERYYQEVNMSVDSQNQKILQEFMDVLDNQEQEHAQQAKQQQMALNNNSKSPKLSKGNDQPIQLNQFYSQKEVPQSNQNSSFSEKQIFATARNNQAQLGNLSSRATQPPVENIRQASAFSRSIGKGKGQLIDVNQFLRESMQLQNRVKSAISKSINAIKRFKEIKGNLQN